ncbi:hypothetical protein Droror1_Dr00025906, partial [Drosera rotundifolia]
MTDVNGQKEPQRLSTLILVDDSADDEDADNEENVSEISEGDTSMGTETDGVSELTTLLKGSASSKKAVGSLQRSNSVSKVSQLSRIPGQTTSPHLSRVNTTRLST